MKCASLLLGQRGGGTLKGTMGGHFHSIPRGLYEQIVRVGTCRKGGWGYQDKGSERLVGSGFENMACRTRSRGMMGGEKMRGENEEEE